MEKEGRQRFQWVKLYEESGDAGLICRRCGISRPALRKWWKRYQAQGVDGLKSQSRRPHSSPSAKIGPDHENLILELRGERNLGARRIQSELKPLHKIFLSVASIHKVLCRHQAKPLVTYRRKKTSRAASDRFPVSGYKWIPATSLLACINTLPWTTVPVIEFCEYMHVELRTIRWIFLIAFLKKGLSPFSAFKRIGAVNFLP